MLTNHLGLLNASACHFLVSVHSSATAHVVLIVFVNTFCIDHLYNQSCAQPHFCPPFLFGINWWAEVGLGINETTTYNIPSSAGVLCIWLLSGEVFADVITSYGPLLTVDLMYVYNKC